MICYHHTDMDGKSGGYIVHKYKPSMIEDNAQNYIPTNYGDNFDKHTEKDDVFIVDISISEGDYKKLINACKTARSVTWIDHHATSVETIARHKEELQRISNLTYFVNTCACGSALAYAYLHIPQDHLMKIRDISENEEYSIDAAYKDGAIKVIISKKNTKDNSGYVWHDYNIPLPLWLSYVDDYDCWKQQYQPNTDYFYLAYESFDTRVVVYNSKYERYEFNNFYDNLVYNPDSVRYLVSTGGNIHKYVHSQYTRELSHTFEYTDKNGTTFICKNGCHNSWEFEHLLEKYPAAILFHYSGKDGLWHYSVYSDEKSNYNCKDFAEKYNGGGHVHASGFSTKYLIFTSPKHQEKKKTDNVIFLGGTCNEDPWRQEFIKIWDRNYIGDEKIELFNPVVDDWTEDDSKKEEEVKKTARINLFVITSNMTGAYSIAEAVESANNLPGKTMLLVIEEGFDEGALRSLKASGKFVVSHDGIYKTYKDRSVNSMISLVNDVIDAL